MTATEPTHRTAAANQARRSTVEFKLARVRDALRQMRRERARVTVAAAARRADVSRTFLYQNAIARGLVDEAAAQTDEQRVLDHTTQASHIEATWRQRALNAEEALKLTSAEISLQRNSIGQLLGRIRDLENDLPEDGIQRLITENTTLNQKVRQLTQHNQTLEERLAGARSNNRFLDKRIAELEAKLAEQMLADDALSCLHAVPAREP